MYWNGVMIISWLGRSEVMQTIDHWCGGYWNNLFLLLLFLSCKGPLQNALLCSRLVGLGPCNQFNFPFNLLLQKTTVRLCSIEVACCITTKLIMIISILIIFTTLVIQESIAHIMPKIMYHILLKYVLRSTWSVNVLHE